MILKEFLKEYPRFSPLLTVPGVEELYEFIAQPSTIESMISASENRRPAIAAITKTLESSFHDNKAGKDGMNFKKNLYLKNFVGNVISHFMQKNGYIKDKNKNLNPQEARYFSAGTLYIKNDSEEELKEKARKFWIKYNVGEKVIRILKTLNRLPDKENSPFRVKGLKALKRKTLEWWPYSWIIEKYYGAKLFITSYQIAYELEREYPGIIALSELEALDFGFVGYKKSYRFFNMIADNLSEYASSHNIKLEIDKFSNAHSRSLEVSLEGLYIYSEKTCNLWRISEFETDRTAEIKRVFETVKSDWNTEMFDKFEIIGSAIKVLSDSAWQNEGRQLYSFMSLHQMAFSMPVVNKKANKFFELIFMELARRIWLGEVDNIQIEFMSGYGLNYLTYHNTPGLLTYIPLFKYKP